MKKIVLAAALCFTIMMALNAQTINEKPIRDLDAEFIAITVSAKPLTNKLYLEIDCGQERRPLSFDNIRLKDSAGRFIIFNSIIEAVNFITKCGYEFVQVYTKSFGTSESTAWYLMRKRKMK